MVIETAKDEYKADLFGLVEGSSSLVVEFLGGTKVGITSGEQSEHSRTSGY